jgi:DNA ligase-1
MERFLALLRDLDQTTATTKKVDSLRNYFLSAPAADACWGLFLLSGSKIPTKVNRTVLQESFCEFMDLPWWLFREAADYVGDGSETMALLRGPIERPAPPPALGAFIEAELLQLKHRSPEELKEKLFLWWSCYDEDTLFLIHKCFSGNLRMGVSKSLLVQALARVAGVDRETMSFRLMGDYVPTPEAYDRLLDPTIGEENRSKPYPYFLASPAEDPAALFSNWRDWCVEWKWDGIRAQLVKRAGEAFLWSRGEELINESFPEVVRRGLDLPDGTVLDGELLPFQDGVVRPFGELQTRLNRKTVTKKELAATPVSLMVYDVLEWAGKDIRPLPLRERRKILDGITVFPLSEPIVVEGLAPAAALLRESRRRGVEGFMLKRWESPYRSGRRRGDWWKWKIDPLTVDCVLLYAQPGTGRRSGLFTDYTLAVWKDGELVPVTKAYSGLSYDELQQMDRWIKRNTLEKFGPVRSVRPEHVFEIAFEGIKASPRHKAGVALRFPRILRWRRDKGPEEADTLEALTRFLTAKGTAHGC